MGWGWGLVLKDVCSSLSLVGGPYTKGLRLLGSLGGKGGEGCLF